MFFSAPPAAPAAGVVGVPLLEAEVTVQADAAVQALHQYSVEHVDEVGVVEADLLKVELVVQPEVDVQLVRQVLSRGAPIELGENLPTHGEGLVDIEHILGVVLPDDVAEHVELVAQAEQEAASDVSRVVDDGADAVGAEVLLCDVAAAGADAGDGAADADVALEDLMTLMLISDLTKWKMSPS